MLDLNTLDTLTDRQLLIRLLIRPDFPPFGGRLDLQSGPISRVGAEHKPEWEQGVD